MSSKFAISQTMRVLSLFTLVVLLSLISAAPIFEHSQRESRVCNPDPLKPSKYSGFRIDRQIILNHDKIFATELHLSVCHEGNLVGKHVKVETSNRHINNNHNNIIPWNQTLCTTQPLHVELGRDDRTHCFKLARRKSFLLRPLMLFTPGEFVGGLFELAKSSRNKLKDSFDEDYLPVGMLVADSVHNQWLEIHKASKLQVYHIPLLYTPEMPQVKAQGDNHWFAFISANERYQFSAEIKHLSKNSFDITSSIVKRVVQNSVVHLKSLNALLNDSKPIRKTVKLMNIPKKISSLAMILKKNVDDLSKFKFNKDQIDFDRMMVLSQILSEKQYYKFLGNLESVYNKFSVNEQIFTYPKME